MYSPGKVYFMILFFFKYDYLSQTSFCLVFCKHLIFLTTALFLRLSPLLLGCKCSSDHPLPFEPHLSFLPWLLSTIYLGCYTPVLLSKTKAFGPLLCPICTFLRQTYSFLLFPLSPQFLYENIHSLSCNSSQVT